MRKRKIHRFFMAFAAVAAMVGCTVICTYIFLMASGGSGGRAASSAQQAFHAAASYRPASSAGKPVSSAVQTKARELVLVGPASKMPDWYAPNIVTAFGVQMDSQAVQPYTEMRKAAAKDGVSLWISSAYRSNALQEELFKKEIAQYTKTCASYKDAVACAEKSVAKPGYSEHATGLAMDLNGVRDDFDQTAAFRWLNTHAQEYGFILRYPKDKQNVTKIKYEPWHYRYVGIQNAKAIKKAGLCLEEYLEKQGKTGAVN